MKKETKSVDTRVEEMTTLWEQHKLDIQLINLQRREKEYLVFDRALSDEDWSKYDKIRKEVMKLLGEMK